MSKPKKSTIEVQGAAITVLSQKEQDFICLTDIARFKNPERSDDLVRNWLRIPSRHNLPCYGRSSGSGAVSRANATRFGQSPSQSLM